MYEDRPNSVQLVRPVLTDRQFDVLRLAAYGRTYQEIGDQLGISIATVRNHLHTTYKRANAFCLADALRAVGWLKVP